METCSPLIYKRAGHNRLVIASPHNSGRYEEVFVHRLIGSLGWDVIVRLKTNVGDVLSAHLHVVVDVLQGWRPHGKRRACRTCHHMCGAHGKEGESGNCPSKCHDDSEEIHSGHLVVASKPENVFRGIL